MQSSTDLRRLSSGGRPVRLLESDKPGHDKHGKKTTLSFCNISRTVVERFIETYCSLIICQKEMHENRMN